MQNVRRDIEDLAKDFAGRVRQAVQRGDLQQAQMCLGGQMALEELQRKIQNRLDTEARIQNYKDNLYEERQERQRNRKNNAQPQPKVQELAS